MADPSDIAKVPSWWASVKSLVVRGRAALEAAAQLADIEKRVGVLEARLARCPDECCPKCRQLTYRVESSHKHPRDEALLVRYMHCIAPECGYGEPEQIWIRRNN